MVSPAVKDVNARRLVSKVSRTATLRPGCQVRARARAASVGTSPSDATTSIARALPRGSGSPTCTESNNPDATSASVVSNHALVPPARVTVATPSTL